MTEQEKRAELEQTGKKALLEAMQAAGLSKEGVVKVWEKIHAEDSEMFMSLLYSGDATPCTVNHKALHAAIENFFFQVSKGLREWKGQSGPCLGMKENPFAKCNCEEQVFPPAPKNFSYIPTAEEQRRIEERFGKFGEKMDHN
jgi:hypothetical protein